jgi:hypothetical protein
MCEKDNALISIFNNGFKIFSMSTYILFIGILLDKSRGDDESNFISMIHIESPIDCKICQDICCSKNKISKELENSFCSDPSYGLIFNL